MVIQTFKACFILRKIYIETCKTQVWVKENKKENQCRQPHATTNHLIPQDPHTLKEMEKGFRERSQKGPPKHPRVSWRWGEQAQRWKVLERRKGGCGACKREVLGASERERRAGNRQWGTGTFHTPGTGMGGISIQSFSASSTRSPTSVSSSGVRAPYSVPKLLGSFNFCDLSINYFSSLYLSPHKQLVPWQPSPQTRALLPTEPLQWRLFL